jgi:hypothetical protein
MKLQDLPQFTVEEVHGTSNDGETLVLGRLSHLRGIRGTRGYFFRPGGPSIVGDLDAVPSTETERVRFLTTEAEYAPELKPGIVYPWLDGNWQPGHISMILSPHERWERRTFSTSPARYFLVDGIMRWQPVDAPLPRGATDLGVHAGGWEHQRCELCPEELSAESTAEGFVDADNRWLCTHCFERYAKSQDISFAIDG